MPVMERVAPTSKAKRAEGSRRGRTQRESQEQQQESQQPQVGNQARLRQLTRKQRGAQAPAQEPDSSDAKANQVTQQFQADPMDQSGRARAGLQEMSSEERGDVMGRVKDKVSETEFGRIEKVAGEPGPRSPGTPPKEAKPSEAPEEMEGADGVPTEAMLDEQAKAKDGQRTAESEKDGRPEARGKGDGAPKPADQEQTLQKAKDAEVAKKPERPTDEERGHDKKAGTDKQAEAAGSTKTVKGRTADPTQGEKPAAEQKVEQSQQDQTEGETQAKKAQKDAALPTKAKQPTAQAEQSSQQQTSDALAGLPASAKGPESGAAPAPGAPARQAATQAGPAVVIAGGSGGGEGGGSGAEAAVEEEQPESAEQEAAGEQAEEKMASAEKTDEKAEGDDDKDAALPESETKSDEATDPRKPPSSEDQVAVREAERERVEQVRSPEPVTGPAVEAEEEESPSGGAAAVEQAVSGEAQAGLASLAEGVGGGGEGAGGGGGGGGGAVSEQQQPEPPQVESMAPVAAVGAIGGLKVGAIAKSITGLQGAVSQKMSGERAELAANAPSMKRPSGSPETRQSPIEFPGVEGTAETIEETPEGEAALDTAIEPQPDPGPSPTADLSTPAIHGGGEGGTLTEAEAQNIEASVGEMPTTDPALDQRAGPPPAVDLSGDADPQQAADQRVALDQGILEQQQQGAADVAQSMGENEIYPVVPEETLQATVPVEGSAAGGGAPAVDDETAAIVAEEKQGDEVRASTQTASADMQAGETEQASEAEKSQVDQESKVQEFESQNAAQQSTQRSNAATEVEQLRGKWSQSQQDSVDKAHSNADTAQSTMDTDVTAKKQQGNEKAAGEIETGDTEITSLKGKAEQEAAQKKAKAKQESSGGVLGWIASKATAFFEGLKKAVSAVFDFFRKAVKLAVETAKKAAAAAIDFARDAIVSAIKVAGAALVAVGDVVLAAFPEARERFRGYIEEKVQAAEDAVNEFAEDLKAGINKLLDAFASVLNGLLSLLEKAYLAAIDIVAKSVEGAIKAAQAAIALLGMFAAIIKDIAAGPGQWLANLGAAVVDGIKNHLWKAFKAAVKTWFMSKLESVLGIGTAIFNILTKGGIKLAEVGKMAFEGLKAAIPPALIALLIEKLVAMIVPAAGAVMAVIEGLQAAWGTISRILQAIDRFVSFLKAVKSGSAGALFADAVASAAVVVIDFVSNWLIRRIRGPASKVGGKIKAIAKRILEKLKAVAKKVGGAIKRAFKKVGDKIKAGFKKVKEKLFGKKKSKKNDSKKKKQSDEQKRHERLQKALGVIRPSVQSMIAGNKSSWVLKAKLLYWKLRYRLTKLDMNKQGGKYRIVAAASPEQMVAEALAAISPETHKIIRDVADQLMILPEVQQRVQHMMDQRGAGAGDTPQNPVQTDTSPLVIGTDILQNARTRLNEHTVLGDPASTQATGSIWRSPTSAPNAMVAAPMVGRPSYTNLTSQLNLGSPSQTASVFHDFHSMGILRPGMSQHSAQVVGTLTHITGVEVARDPAHAVRYAAALEAMKNGTMTKEELFILQNPLSPMKEKPSAARTASEINREDKPSRGSKYKTPLKGAEARALPDSKAAFLAKEKSTMIAWMVGLMTGTDPLFHSDEGRRTFVRTHMWDYLKGLGKSTSGIS